VCLTASKLYDFALTAQKNNGYKVLNLCMCLLITLFNSVNEPIIFLHCHMRNLADLITELQFIRLFMIQKGDNEIKRDTSSGTVAENNSVCRSLGIEAIIFSISLLNPISNRRSASSRTRTFTPLSLLENPGVFSR